MNIVGNPALTCQALTTAHKGHYPGSKYNIAVLMVCWMQLPEPACHLTISHS